MALYEQEFLRPGAYDLGDGRSRTLTAEDLARLQANTQALLEAGYEIPVLLRHPAAGSTAGGPRPPQPAPASSNEDSAPLQDSASIQDGAFPAPLGRLVAVRQSESGALIHQLELPYEDEAELVESVGLRQTSPELRETYTDATGQERGPIIAHIALTSRPRVDNQPPLALTAVRLSLRDLAEQAPSEAETTAAAASETPAESPSAEQFVAVQPADELPAGEQPTADPPTDDLPTHEPAPGEAALGPEDLVALGAQVAGEESAALASEQQRRYRQELAERIRRSRRLPLGLRERLASTVGAVQLSRDGDEEPSLKLSEAVALLEEALPEQLALAGGGALVAEHPAGERFFTGERGPLSDDQATRLAREQLLATGFARRE